MEDKKHPKISLRSQVSILLIVFALLAWIIPDRTRSAAELSPANMVEFLQSEEYMISADQVARILSIGDEAYRFIDLRSPDEYMICNIPGAINIPAADILNPDWSGYLEEPGSTTVLYSNGSTLASEVLYICIQSGYSGIKAMHGGMNAWFQTVMEAEFSGDRISAAENALFESRYRARDYFIKMNSLPDSLKTVFLTVKRKQEEELTGGCE